MKGLMSVALGTGLLLFPNSTADAQSQANKLDIRVGVCGTWCNAVPAKASFTNCVIQQGNSILCSFKFRLDQDKDADVTLGIKDNARLILSDGTSYAPSKISLNSVNNGAEVDKDIGTKIFAGIDYQLQARFEDIPSNTTTIRFLDIGVWREKLSRIENISVRGTSATPLPAPQPVSAPKQYLTANASQGFGAISGVSLNGGMYDVTLQGCRTSEAGRALCTFSLSPMRAAAQTITLEDFSVNVSGAAASATASALPTVTTIQVTVPTSVNRIDEVRFGNARFLNVAVR